MRVTLYFDVWPGMPANWKFTAFSEPGMHLREGHTRYRVEVEVPDPWPESIPVDAAVEDASDEFSTLAELKEQEGSR